MNLLIKVNQAVLRSNIPVLSACAGSNSALFSTTSCKQTRKNKLKRRNILEPKHPFDKRFHISPRDVGPGKAFGSRQLQKELAQHGYGVPQLPGYFEKSGNFTKVPEMVPEFVVPDLDGFELKPYVSFKVPLTESKEFSSKDLFEATYGKDIVTRYRASETLDPDTYFSQKPGAKDDK